MRFHCAIAIWMCLAQAAHAQSIIYSPVAAFSPDLVPTDTAFDFVYLYDHSGLYDEFTSGETTWAEYLDEGICASLHEPFSTYEEFFGMAAENMAHLVLDMGVNGPWDRIAIYNEEYAGLGTDPITLSHAPSATGPWVDLCQLALTDAPGGAYGPDIGAFEEPLTARYFRITASGSTHMVEGQYLFSVGEIFFGTADATPPKDACVQPCTATSVRPAPLVPFVVMVDPASSTVSVKGLSGVQRIACYDTLGHLMTSRSGVSALDISSWADGTYVLHAQCTNGAVAARFVKTAGR